MLIDHVPTITGAKGVKLRDNYLGVVTTKEKSNFPFVVQIAPTENWSSKYAYQEEGVAVEQAQLIAKVYPTMAVRVLHYIEGRLS